MYGIKPRRARSWLVSEVVCDGDFLQMQSVCLLSVGEGFLDPS